MRRLIAITALAFVVLVAGGAAADTFAVHLVSQTSNTITLGWDPQPGYGYLFSADGQLVSRTNDPNRATEFRWLFTRGELRESDRDVAHDAPRHRESLTCGGHYTQRPPMARQSSQPAAFRVTSWIMCRWEQGGSIARPP